MRRRRLAVAVLLIALPAVFLISVWRFNAIVKAAAESRLFSKMEQLPDNDVGLVLGTSKRLRSGQSNPFFVNRMKAAADLYHAGKIRHVLVSGDNRYLNYNEPRDMTRALLELGVPRDAITLDYAGFRTLDSVVRAGKVFGLQRFTIISQENHNYRALFIARHYRLDAVGFNASPVSLPRALKTRTREILARYKAVLDLYILKTEPKFLGKPEPIVVADRRGG